MGRKSQYTEEAAEQIIEMLSDGIPLREICRIDVMPAWRTVYDWMNANSDFAARIARAREMGEEAISQECLQIADTPVMGIKTVNKATGMETTEGDMIEHRKLQIETRLKLLAKWNPKKWGDKVTLAGDKENPLQVEQTLDVSKLSTAALTEILAAKNETNNG